LIVGCLGLFAITLPTTLGSLVMGGPSHSASCGGNAGPGKGDSVFEGITPRPSTFNLGALRVVCLPGIAIIEGPSVATRDSSSGLSEDVMYSLALCRSVSKKLVS
jgi:hypothetical protein